MDFERFEPVYEAILADFGYPREADERARDRIAALTDGFDLDRLPSGGTVAIAGAGPSLEAELAVVADADYVFAASTAADRLLSAGVGVDCQVTDLDKGPGTTVELSQSGTPVAVHAHGDNLPAVESTVPECDRDQVLATTQARPVEGVYNVGGFTDGDRAAFLADHLGAEKLAFAGWDFADPGLTPEKKRKLTWARRLLYWLERSRDERFAVLDGWRERTDLEAFPPAECR